MSREFEIKQFLKNNPEFYKHLKEHFPAIQKHNDEVFESVKAKADEFKKAFNKREILNIMLDGGLMLCDRAIEKWFSNDYTDDLEIRKRNIKELQEKKESIKELYLQIKGGMANE